MSRFLPGLLLAGVCAGVLLPSCSTSGTSASVPLPPGLPTLQAGEPTGKGVWERSVLADLRDARLTAGWIAGGLVILQTSVPSLVGLDLATGEERFGLALNRPALYAPVSDGQKLALVTMDRLYVLDARIGTILVSRHLDVIPAGPPVLKGDTVYISTLDRYRILAFNARTGRQGWSWLNGEAPVGGPALCRAPGRRDTLVVYMDTGTVYGLNATQAGEAGPKYPLWELKGGGDATGEITVKGNTAFIASSDKHLYAVDGSSGKALWVHAAGVPFQGKPLVGGERVLAQAGPTLVCLDLATGNEAWSFPGYVQPLRVTPGFVEVSASDNRVIRLSRDRGQVQGSWKVAGTAWLTNPHGDLLIGWTQSGKVTARR